MLNNYQAVSISYNQVYVPRLNGTGRFILAAKQSYIFYRALMLFNIKIN